MKRRGPKTEPCGTPVVRGARSEEPESVWTNWFLSVRYKVIRSRAGPRMPKVEESLVSRMAWSMVSKAADRSRRMREVTCRFSTARKRSF